MGTVNRAFRRILLMSLILAVAYSAQSAIFPETANAAIPDSIQDTLSDSRESVSSRHTIIIDQSPATSFDAIETIIITFPAQFVVPSFTASDVSLSDGTPRTILGSCSVGANNVSVSVSGQIVTFSACSGFSSQAAGNPITIVLGTGSTLTTNPTNSGIYYVEVAGTYGDDQRGTALAITEGVSLSFTVPSPNGNVRFTGDAFPNAFITILDGGAVVGTSVANATSFFDKTITGLSPTTHTFGIFGQSLDGRKTLTISFNINVIGGSTTTVGGILLPPIISVPATEKRPATLVQNGLARHNSTVTTFTNSHNAINRQVTTNSSGEWAVHITDILHLGGHTASALVNDGSGNQSILTDAKSFEILLSADLNIDNLVSLTDFSILMFNYGTSNPPNLAADINDNGGTVDLVDFSVMMYYWTGG